MSGFAESTVEEAALAWLEELGYVVAHGPEIAYGAPGALRTAPDYRDVVLEGQLRQALGRLNTALPPEAVDDAYRKLIRADAPSLIERNRAIHRMLVNGVNVEYRRPDGSVAGAQAAVLDCVDPGNNDWLAVNQFTVVEGQHDRRPDIVLFVNGLPLAVIELKNAAEEDATVWHAFRQLKTYQAQIPSLFAGNVALVASDGVQARVGVVGAERRVVQAMANHRADSPTPRQRCQSSTCCWRASSSTAASLTCCATSSCSRTPAAGLSPRRSPGTTSSTR